MRKTLKFISLATTVKSILIVDLFQGANTVEQ